MVAILSLLVGISVHAADVKVKGPGTFYVPANYDEIPEFNPVQTENVLRGIASEDDEDDVEVDEDTPVSLDEIEGERNLTDSRPWRAPDYTNQEKTFGFSEKSFSVHPALEKNVKFWIDIYSKYSTDQGLLHDGENIDFVYEIIDFTAIAKRGDINIFKKEALKLKAVKDRKKFWIATLKGLQKKYQKSLKSKQEIAETDLSSDELRIWTALKEDNSKKKFDDATGKNRLRFQLGQKDRVIQGIYFSGRYLEDFEKIFRDNNLPLQLARLPFVESSYNVMARSRVGASGLWQIMPGTGKPFMMINDVVDKRNHPVEAAKLAAKILKKNYELLGSWDLALTGYNHGPYGMLKLKKKYKLDTLGDMIESKVTRSTFGFASKNFFASFLAIIEVEGNAPKYLGPVLWSKPLDMREFKTPNKIRYSQVLKWFDGDDKKTQIFNPQLTSAARKKNMMIPKGAIIGVPTEKFDVVKTELNLPAEMVLERLSANPDPK